MGFRRILRPPLIIGSKMEGREKRAATPLLAPKIASENARRSRTRIARALLSSSHYLTFSR